MNFYKDQKTLTLRLHKYERHSSQSQGIHQEIDVFVRPSDIFKEAKANLREKGHI